MIWCVGEGAETAGDNGDVYTYYGIDNTIITYSRDELMAYSSCRSDLLIDQDLKNDLRRCTKYRKKRGRRGGVRMRLERRENRPPLPSIITGNVRSLRNKHDELAVRCKYDFAYRNASMLCLTETWLKETDPDSYYELDDYTLIRSDRNGEDCKTSGGGVCIYLKDAWCKNYNIVAKYCDANIELLTVKLRPFYLPGEFNQIIVLCTYIPPDGDVNLAADKLYSVIQNMENDSPDSVKIITGDFNQCDFASYIPHYQQYINCNTRGDRILDLFFCNVKHSYVAKRRSPLGISDHNIIEMLPIYRQKLKQPKQYKEVRVWNNDVEEELISCFESTDWDVLYNANECLDQNVDVVSSYITFCTVNIVPSKRIRIYANNKPWMKKELRDLFHEKDICLRSDDRDMLKIIQKNIDKAIKACKQEYCKKVNDLFSKNCVKDAWLGLKKITGMTKAVKSIMVDDVKQYCNDLVKFYSRFDIYDFQDKCGEILDTIKQMYCEKVTISVDEVEQSFSKIKVHKASGPDKISGRVLKLGKTSLAYIFHLLFQRSLCESYVPVNWKLSEIIPLPKKPQPKVLNDFRPVALTSVAMKCLEKIIKVKLMLYIGSQQDPLQFAYTKNRSTLDPTIMIVHDVLKFLDTPNTKDRSHFVKILFIDFSSAFNTIQVHIMLNRLINLQVNPNIILWIYSFLSHRQQYVKLNGTISDTVYTETGAPQGCVLSPLLFTLYTNTCRSDSLSCKIFKYADDTALVGFCLNNDNEYQNAVKYFISWCKENYLLLNVQKTKELVIDYRRTSNVHEDLVINEQIVERVSEYKYLGTIIDCKLNFESNVNSIYKKANSRMFFVRKLHRLHVNKKIVELFYRSIVEATITFGIAVWYGNCSQVSKNKICKVIKYAKSLGIVTAKSLLELYEKCAVQKAKAIKLDCKHPLHKCYQMLRSGRRFQQHYTRTTRLKKSFVPASVKLLNNL